ncbi:hypothetical protein WJX73_007692 [Symbiochloris irregularis]|uniref:peptidyl-tRNA hydrolase n=1 Tax=Symbiochloris irregularis TaxID=706552 RepID=A0AAW1PFM9_9CHLO
MEHPNEDEQAWALVQSLSVGSRDDQSAPSTSHVSPMEPVWGIPSDGQGPVVVHPDGASTQALLVGVGSECKVVLVVAQSLGMSSGKIAAQCAHAILGLYRRLQHKRTPWMQAWEASGEKTVVLAGDTPDQLQHMADSAAALGLPAYLVMDAGRTEIQPGSKTVLAIGGVDEAVDQITGQLRTLK